MTINHYLEENIVRLSVQFTDFAGAPISPTTVTCIVKKPSGNTDNPAIVNDTGGAYHADYLPTEFGMHYYVFRGTGNVTVAQQSQFVIYELVA
jgi:hypothetical protein